MVKRHKKERYARSADLLMSLKKYLNHADNVKALCLPITEKFSVSGLYVVRDAMSHNKFAALEDQLVRKWKETRKRKRKREKPKENKKKKQEKKKETKKQRRKSEVGDLQFFSFIENRVL